MTNTKHTPSPWSVEFDESRGYFQINTDMHAICTNSLCYEPFNIANAHLIAAAPELLEACKAAEKLLSRTLSRPEINPRHPIHALRAAIAKARGGAA